MPDYGEPWEAEGDSMVRIGEVNGDPVAIVNSPRYAHRIITCVTAMRDIEDPVKLRRQRDRLRDAAKAMMNAWWLRPDRLHVFSAQPPPSNMQAELTVIYKELDAAIKETEEV